MKQENDIIFSTYSHIVLNVKQMDLFIHEEHITDETFCTDKLNMTFTNVV